MHSSTAAATTKNSALPRGCCVPYSALGLLRGKVVRAPAAQGCMSRGGAALKFVIFNLILAAAMGPIQPTAAWANTMAGPGTRAGDPLDKIQILALLAGGVTSERIATLVEKRGIEFSPTENYLERIQKCGAKKDLVEGLQTATVKAAESDVRGEANRARIQQHLLHGIEFKLNEQYSDAEKEYRAALELQPDNPTLHFSLGYILARQDLNKGVEAISQLREALRLDPDDADAHRLLGMVLLAEEAPHPAVPEFRELVRLEPNDSEARCYLGSALLMTRELNSAVVEFREALRLKPDYFEAHVGLAAALAGKKDAESAIAELGEALRLQPNHAETHFDLAAVLEENGEKKTALEHYRAAHQLEPSNSLYDFRYERLSRELGSPLTSKDEP